MTHSIVARTVNSGRIAVPSNAAPPAHTATAALIPLLLPRTHGGLPVTSTAVVPCALMIAVHKNVGNASRIDVRPVVADVGENDKGGTDSRRLVATGFILVETLKTKGFRCCDKSHTSSGE